ncbi:winged helix-turn-helix transcriptional regulator [Pseudomonas wadenswilerensis]
MDACEIESWGRGIEKILSECREHGIPVPVFDGSLSGLMLTFRTRPTPSVLVLEEEGQVYGTTQETTQESAPENVREKILVQLRRRPTTTRFELARALGLTPEGIKYHLNKLRAEGVVRHVGSTKSGHWEVLK